MASFTVPCPKAASTPLARLHVAPSQSRPNASLSFGFQGRNNRIQTRPNKVTMMAASSSNSVAIPAAKPVADSPEVKGESLEETVPGNSVPDQLSIVAFMDQVSELVKLVDSRDIVELQLKQRDCELLIRKKEAIEQPAAQFPYAQMQHPLPPAMYAPPPPPPAQAAPVVAPAAASTPQSAPSKAVKSSHPPLMCPMAGTFYRSPGPGEPPFVKVGDKVQQGQVICIIEAMKLMNEIEADQSGTITEVLTDDGKPVSVGTPLFVIAP